jgi:CheY-like chemotaxis protein
MPARRAIARPPRILIADDSATHRLLLEFMLDGEYEVRVASDGEAALECAASFQPDLALLDVVMPRMDGLTTCRRLRALPSGQRMPIILVTSRRDEPDVEAGYASGCTDYIAKPVDRFELLAKIESWLAVYDSAEGKVP